MDQCAIVLAGGRATRMGRDKVDVSIKGRTLLERTIDALATRVEDVIVVGPPRDVTPQDGPWPAVQFVLEDPPFSGPVAALKAGFTRCDGDIVTVFAADQEHPNQLLEALDVEIVGDGVAAADRAHVHYLAARYKLASLERRFQAFEDVNGASMRRFVSGLDIATVEVSSLVAADIDTPEALSAARERG